MRQNVLDYIQEELSSIEERLEEFLSFGYSSELESLVDVMIEYKNKLKTLKDNETERI